MKVEWVENEDKVDVEVKGLKVRLTTTDALRLADAIVELVEGEDEDNDEVEDG